MISSAHINLYTAQNANNVISCFLYVAPAPLPPPPPPLLPSPFLPQYIGYRLHMNAQNVKMALNASET